MSNHKIFRSVVFFALAAAFAALSLGLFAQATPPARVNYQGVLRDSLGNPLGGLQTMTFRFYDAASLGTLLWEEIYDPGFYAPQVTVSNGLFTVALGNPTHYNAGIETVFSNVFANHAPIYLAVQVGADSEMTPRIQVVSAPFAENAATLVGRQASSFANVAHAHDTSNITSGTLAVARGGTGLAFAGANGNILTSNGTTWASAAPATAAAQGAVVDAYNTTLTRSGTGTGLDPYKLALNLSNANTWAGAQTFNANTYFPGSGIWNTSGNVGIGTTVATWPLTVQANQAVASLNSTASTSGSVLVLNNNTLSPTLFGAINFTSPVAGTSGQITYTGGSAMTFSTANAERMRIASTGNVGIGTATPGFPLTFASTLGDKISLYGQSGTHYGFSVQGGLLQIHSDTAASDIAFGYGTSGAFTEAMRIGGDGNVGIGAAPDLNARLFVQAAAGAHAFVGVEGTFGGVGIDAGGSWSGGYFEDTVSSGYANVGYGSAKIQGSGAVSFVQNHPTEKDKVIVYACPEGDEVATYTRGSAKLINGEAHVKLGETFQWVTNPDIGLTAHLTPHGEAVPLAVKSLSTTELVVKGPKDGPADLAFDYMVYGLRIGFEESSIVQEKQQESYIPSFKRHRERYAKYPELRAFNSLERFKGMESSVRGVEPASIDLSRAKALKDAIHEYDPATDPPVDKLFGYDHGHNSSGEPHLSGPRPISAPRPAHAASQPVPPSDDNPANGASEAAGGGATIVSNPALPCFPASEAVEPGDVVVIDLSRKGNVRRCAAVADPLVLGIAAGPAEGCTVGQGEEDRFAPARVPVASFGIVPCKADASYGPIREGDLLVASPTPGHAMRAVDSTPGAVLGKALEPLATGTGLINVLITLR